MSSRSSWWPTLLIAVLVLGPACPQGSGDTTSEGEAELCLGDPATSTGGTATGAGGLCPDHADVDACCCFDPSFDGVQNYPVVCGKHFLCQEVVLPGGWQNGDCGSALDCALAALAEGTPGTIRWYTPNEYGGETIEVHIVGDGTAFRERLHEEDLGCEIYPVERYTIAEPATFAACATSVAFDDRVACLRSAFAGEVLETCTPPEGQGCGDIGGF